MLTLRLVDQVIGDFHSILFRLGSGPESEILIQRSTRFRAGFRTDLNVSNLEPIRFLLGADYNCKFLRSSDHDSLALLSYFTT
jgi:hypothetical protein